MKHYILIVIVISHIITLWLKFGFYSFNYHSNTVTDNYNWSFAKNGRPLRIPKRVRTLKSDKNYGRYNIKRTGTPKKILCTVTYLLFTNQTSYG